MMSCWKGRTPVGALLISHFNYVNLTGGLKTYLQLNCVFSVEIEGGPRIVTWFSFHEFEDLPFRMQSGARGLFSRAA